MLSEDKRAAILEMHRLGHSIHRIARALRASRITVRRIIKSGVARVPPISRHSRVEGYRDLIIDLCSRCQSNLRRVHTELTALGAQFSYSALTGFVRRNQIRDLQSDVRRSITAAQDWLNHLAHGSSAFTLFNTVVGAQEDLATLLYHLRNGKVRQRKQAATILARIRGIPNAIVSVILHSSPKTTRRYFTLYKEAGVSAVFVTGTSRPGTQTEDPAKTRDLLELLHQKPTSFGINRTSWTQRTLTQAYKDTYKRSISTATVKRLIKNAGYGWRRARRVLTSPDPAYTDKVELLSKTLRSLAPTELLFFLDEWGPVQVKKRGGRTYSTRDNNPTIPRYQPSRGTVALAASLSATTNQLTWMFVTSKDTLSMIGLLEVLYNQYHANSKLFVAWDAVSWHNSAALTDWMDDFNQRTREAGAGPMIELVPLPTSAQFLNVIEGVLSGMTRAVVNNSDYCSADEMKAAISQYFLERNKSFIENPRRAGKAIWESDFFHGLDTFTKKD
jgi:transposase